MLNARFKKKIQTFDTFASIFSQILYYLKDNPMNNSYESNLSRFLSSTGKIECNPTSISH